MDPVGIGCPAPDFQLVDLHGSWQSLSRQRGNILVLIFWSANCPWSQYGDEVIAGLRDGYDTQVKVWRIASNADETVQEIQLKALQNGMQLVLLDPDQRVADLYGAVTTPHAFVVDKEGVMQYQGAVNDATFRHRTPSRQYLGEAIAALIDGRIPETRQTPGYGCAIVRKLDR